MNSISNNVKILFRYAKPEKVTGTYDKNMQTICYNDIPRKLYIQYARECYPNKSDNELTEYYNQLKNYITLLNSKDFFYLLSDFGKQSLDICNGTPVVKFESIVNWQDTSHEIGQSVIVAAYLARNSLEKGVKQDFFAWPTTLRTNNRQLQNILNEGISENHYHLNGSTQVFPITWVSLMNIPTKIPSVTKKINVNLAPHTSFGEKDNQLSWNLLLKEAAIIRYNLFCRTHNYDNIITYDHSCVSFANLQRKIVALSHTEAFKFSKGKYFLDYAINKNTSENNLGCNRVLVGERKFLYDCFKASFSGKFSYTENNHFYKYLLIKSNFRSEIIQNNRFTGFENFSNYQNRKSYAIDGVYKYECEAIGTAINEVLDVQPILSLEARVMPRENRKRLISDINFYDTTYKKKLLENKKSYDDVQKIHFPYFYVLHYPKGCEKAKKNMLFIPKPRNFKQRKKYKKCSLTTMNCLNHRSFLRDRILGIDTCSNEIGCRPEVFATEYRYLKNFNMYHHQLIKASTQERSYLLNRTYHVGEDFLDLVDGLRAIDEVIKFLEFSHGDRFGHALALGVNPKEYYQFKNHTIILPKQDALDNFVWMYMRSNEMNISIEPLLKQKLESKINELANIIYGDFVRKFSISNLSLDPYSLYCAWKLRGDNPECYKTIKFMVDPAAHTIRQSKICRIR